MTRLPVHIRWMNRHDMEQVLAIEQGAFEFPWSEGEFAHYLRPRNNIGMVAVRDDPDEKIVGYMIYELHKTSLYLQNFAVHPLFRRRGVGAQMIEKLFGKLSSQRRTMLLAVVRDTNLPAHLFLKASGFSATGVLRNFYDESPEDAYMFERHLEDRPVISNPLILSQP